MKLHIGFVTGGLPFDGLTLQEKSLGGSETALYYMAKELAARGHDVRVFCSCPRPGRYDGVQYHDLSSWKDLAGIVEFDALVVSRWYNFLATPSKAKMRIFWTHDMPSPDAKAEMPAHMFQTDMMFVLSEFQRKQYIADEMCPELDPLIRKTTNGVDWDYIQKCIADVPKNRKRLIYSSRPERGLYLLLSKIWPALLDEDPELELVISSYDISAGGVQVPEQTMQIYQACNDLIMKSKNVFNAGNLKKEDYYKLLASSSVMVYPTNFPEISCINAMESLACGTPLVSTRKFALTETASQGAELSEDPYGSPEYIKDIVFKTLNLVKNDVHYRMIRKSGRDWIRSRYQWKRVAEQWEDLIMQHFKERQVKYSVQVFNELVRNDDLLSAKEFAHQLQLPEQIDWIEQRLKDMSERRDKPEETDRADNHSVFDQAGRIIGRFGMVAERIAAKAKNAPKPIRVLDVGCNQGHFAAFLATSPKVADVYGMDYNEYHISVAKKRVEEKQQTKYGDYTKCEFRLTRAGEDLSELYGKFDAVFAGEILEHIPETQEFLEWLRKFCTPDGIVILTCPQGCWKPLRGPASEEDVKAPREHVWHFEMADVKDIFGDQPEFDLGHCPAGTNYAGELIGNWVVCFQNSDKPFGKLDMKRKLLTAVPYFRISACMITRNAQNDLGRCLQSYRDVVDELIVVDTGSQDATVSLAKQLADKVKEIEWPENFAAARNVSIEEATGDWIFWIDADEVLVGATGLRKYTKSQLFNGYVIRQHHLMLDFKSDPDIPIRMFKNNKGYMFYGVIHEHCEEQMDTPILPAMVCPDVNIAHFGYLVEQIRRDKCKHRNLPLLVKDRQVNPQRKLGLVLEMRDYINAGNWSMEAAGHQITDEAAKYFRTIALLYHKHLKEGAKTHVKVQHLAFPLYQQALATLGRHGVPVADGIKYPPFEAALFLASGFTGISAPAGTPVQPERRWFATHEEHKEYLTSKEKELRATMEATITNGQG